MHSVSILVVCSNSCLPVVGPWQAVDVFDPATELARREALCAALAEEMVGSAAIRREKLEEFDFGYGPERIIDEGGGIWNPSAYAATLSIIHRPGSRYDDGSLGSGFFRYAYQVPKNAANPTQGKNVKLRRAGELALPIVMFLWISDGLYVPVAPVYVVEDDPRALQVILNVDERLRFLPTSGELPEDLRRYAERTIQQRLHQPEFRARVLLAYQNRCAVCVLQKVPLLDAAHITSDGDEGGLPVVSNGLTLCKIHHAAYDQNLLGITPDFVVKINDGLLIEVDGPMLLHGLQEMDGRELWVPRRNVDRPDRDRLAARFDEFVAAG